MKKIFLSFVSILVFMGALQCKSTKSQQEVEVKSQGQQKDSGVLVQAIVKKLSEIADTGSQTAIKGFFSLLATAKETGVLESVVRKVIAHVNSDLPKVEQLENINYIMQVVNTELYYRGKDEQSRRLALPSWKEIHDSLQVSHTDEYRKALARAKTQGSPFDDAQFRQQFAKASFGPLVKGERGELLVNGPKSFAKRKQLLEVAQQRIYISSWAIYDDETGKELVNVLKEKHSQGVDIRIMVDGFYSTIKVFRLQIEELERSGIQVIRWSHPSYPYHGMHRKLFIVDDVHLIAGGMNYGNEYSHHPALTDPQHRWWDLDFYVKGELAVQALELYVHRWNAQVITQRNSMLTTISDSIVSNAQRRIKDQPNDRPATMHIVDHAPAGQRFDPIYETVIKSIYAASENIKINMSYFIITPPLKTALILALKRGVKVTILTNSAESIDTKILANPILESLPELIREGAQVYLKKGAGIHTKAMMVDDRWGWIGSYNLHPRSYFYEGEVIIGFFDHPQSEAGIVDQWNEMFFEQTEKCYRENGCTKITNINQLKIPRNMPSKLARALFYHQL